MNHSLTMPADQLGFGSEAPATPDPAEEVIDIPFGRWVYMNVCIYGMQILRRVYRFERFVKRLLRPVFAAIGAQLRKLAAGAASLWATTRVIASDTKRAFGRIAASRKEGGISAMAVQTGRVLSAGARKHGAFAASVANYCLPVLCIALLIFTIAGVFGRNYALAVECDGNVVGYIAEESTYTAATELVSQRVISSSEDFTAALQPSYSLVTVDESELDSAPEICENILLNSDDVSEAYGLFIDGELLGAVKSEGDITFILDRFLEKFRRGAEQETISFVGETDIVRGLYASEMILDSAQFKEAISATKMESQLHTVAYGETLNTILGKYSMTESRFFALNKNFDGTLKKGDTVVVEKEQPVLTVQNVVVSSYEATIAYTTITEKDSTKYTTYKQKKQTGSNGTQRVTQQITYIDGVEVAREVISRETLVEPVNEIYVVGTKKTTTTRYNSGGGNFSHSSPDKGVVDSSGSWAWPLPGVNTISSYYGPRWGRLHSGIDISCGGVYGRTIVAAKSGTVTTVKRVSGGYGLYLIISHGNGYSTLYAHCSEILVSAGQTVSKGQAIAKVGNSGASTGPHLHFEIRVNGTAKNPLNYY